MPMYYSLYMSYMWQFSFSNFVIFILALLGLLLFYIHVEVILAISIKTLAVFLIGITSHLFINLPKSKSKYLIFQSINKYMCIFVPFDFSHQCLLVFSYTSFHYLAKFIPNYFIFLDGIVNDIGLLWCLRR